MLSEQQIIKNLDSIDIKSYFNICNAQYSGQEYYELCMEPVLFDRFAQYRYNLLKNIGFIEYQSDKSKQEIKKLYIIIKKIIQNKFINQIE